MKKSITMIGYRRPYLMKRTLEYLLKNDLEGWDIYIGIEKYDAKSMELHKQFIQEYVPQAKVFYRDWHYTLHARSRICRNMHDIISKAYGGGSEYNIHLEDDVVISPDVTQLADWYGQNEFNDIFCLTFANQCKLEFIKERIEGVCELDKLETAVLRSRELYNLEKRVSGFHGFAHCTRRREWYDFISAATFNDKGWDWGWAYEILHKNFSTLLPCITRCDHLGTHGVHIKNSTHNRKKGWGFHEIYDGAVKKEDFVLL